MEYSKLVNISQTVAVLIDGNNVEISIHELLKSKETMINYDSLIPRLISPQRSLNRLVYCREGEQISSKLARRLHSGFFGVVKPCGKNADIQIALEAVQLAPKVDTIIIMSGDKDYTELVKYLKSQGIRVEIAAVKSTTAQVLIDEADFFHEITKDDCFKYKPQE